MENITKSARWINSIVPNMILMLLQISTTIFFILLKQGMKQGMFLLEQAQRKEKYTSGVIQNQLIYIIGKQILGMILQDVHKGSQFFSVQADDTQDDGNIEQLTVCIRYVNCTGECTKCSYVKKHYINYL